MGEKIDLKVKVSKEIGYYEDSMFGIYSLHPLEKENQLHNYNDTFRNFLVTGNCPQLFKGKEYNITIEESYHKKYGKGYSFVMVKQPEPTTIQEQQTYIRTLLSEKQAEAIIGKYPNDKILDLMRSGEFSYDGINGIGKVRYEGIKHFLLSHLNIQQALVQLKDLNISFKAMNKLMKHFGSPDVVVQKVRNNIYNLCKVDGFGFKKVDEYALNRGDSKTNANRIVEGIKYALEQDAMKGNSWMSYSSLLDTTGELLQIESNHIESILEKLKEESDDFYFDGDKVSLYRNFYFEKEIRNKLIKLMKGNVKTKVDNVEEKIDQLEDEKDITFTHEQRNAIKLAVENNVLVINGKGGVGKTFTLQGILDALSDYKYVACSLSGKASKIMSNHGLNAMTIHRMLEIDPVKGGFRYNSNNKLPYDIVVIDETSMCNTYLIYSILSAMSDDSKLIMLGDNAQLPSIGVGAVFDDILNTNTLPQQELTIVQRQAQKSGILNMANMVRDGKQITGRYNYEKQVHGELKDFVVIPVKNKEYIKNLALDICEKFKGKDISEFQVITGLKSRGDLSVVNLNIELQKIFNDTSKPYIKRGRYEYRENDKVIHSGNNYTAGKSGETQIFNGTLGKVVEVIKDKELGDSLVLEFEGVDELVEYASDDLDKIELAYAISVHKSQGSTIQHVLFVFDYSSYMLLSKEFIYTGISRASKGLVMICENNALHHGISNSQGGSRRTWLKEMLLNL